MHYHTEFNAEQHYRQREYNSYWLQCIQQCLTNLRSPDLIIGYYYVLPTEELRRLPQTVGGYDPLMVTENIVAEPQLLDLIALQEADIRLEREELNYLSHQVVDTVERYIYLDQDQKVSQDLRWVLTTAKEKERTSTTKRHESTSFKLLLNELCEELNYFEYTLKLMS